MLVGCAKITPIVRGDLPTGVLAAELVHRVRPAIPAIESIRLGCRKGIAAL